MINSLLEKRVRGFNSIVQPFSVYMGGTALGKDFFGIKKFKMIEQTDLIVKEWIYIPPVNLADSAIITSHVSLEVMKKRTSEKKGIACRFSCKFLNEKETILLYIGEDSYVIDLEDVIDKSELLKMIRNSYAKFTEKFEFRKLGTQLQHKTLIPLDEISINVNAILPLLNS